MPTPMPDGASAAAPYLARGGGDEVAAAHSVRGRGRPSRPGAPAGLSVAQIQPRQAVATQENFVQSNFVQSNFVVAGRDDLEHQLEIVEHRKKGC